jgi:hypothetical protein
VTFEYKDYRLDGPDRHKTMTLEPSELIRRFLMHVWPKGFHRMAVTHAPRSSPAVAS